MRCWILVAGLGILAAAWLGPLPELSRQLFSAHMSLHVTVIAIAAPLLALGIAGHRLDPVRHAPKIFSPIPASIFELVVVWAWHAPALHHLARESVAILIVEQMSFLAVGFLVWMSALGGSRIQQRERAIASVSGLLLTSMHMTLLGVLLALANRPLYVHGSLLHDGALPFTLTPLQDQHFGGVIMLFFGGAVYLIGVLYRVSGLLKERGHVVSAG
ncbi:MAG TPA: cytochrome c oxidase assembly protein [Gammaproteobacteria bacterium]